MKFVANFILLALVVLFLFIAHNEIRFQFMSETATGTVTSVHKEFAGFSESRTAGTRPRYQTTSNYAFNIGDKTYHGSDNLMSRRTGESVSIQYIQGNPSESRAYSSGMQSAVMMLVLALALFIVWKLRHVFLLETNAG